MKSILRLLALSLLLASCGPTYPKEKIISSLKSLCQEEYKTHVEATIAATTIGVLVPVDGLFEVQAAGVSERELKKLSEGLPFSKGALDKIEVASRALSRVVLSTDAPLEFYTIVARDVPTGVEFLWSGYITDLKRLNYFDISQGDFLRYRTPISLRIAPTRVAEKTVENFFRDLATRSMAQILRRNISPSARVEEILLGVLQLRQAGTVGARSFRAGRVASTPLSDGDVVVLWESTLFVVETSETRGLIREIHPLPDSRSLPYRYRHLGDPSTWESRFVIEPFSLPQFLADQIARRTQLDLVTSKEPPAHPLELGVAGSYKDRNFDFQFHSTELSRSSDELAATIVRTAAEVLHSYRFQDFQSLMVTDALRGTRWLIPAKDLPLYRRRHPPALQTIH